MPKLIVPRIAKLILKIKKTPKVGELIFSNVKTNYKNYNNQDIDPWTRINSPEINSHIYNQLLFN